MAKRNVGKPWFLVAFLVALVSIAALPATAQSFRAQCPTSTITHPGTLTNANAEPAYTGPTTQVVGAKGYLVPSGNVNGAIKCQQVSGGDGFEVGAVATVVGEGSTPVEFDHLRRESVEEVAIVGDEDNRGCGGGEPLFEPEDSGEVEVVGGLVQDQQVHLFCGGGRQGDALGLSS